MSTSAEQVAGLNTLAERRFYPRVAPNALIFVALANNEEGMLLNVSENGLQISTPTELKHNFVSRVCLQLNGLPKAVNVHARVVWASEATKRAGMQLLDLSEFDREQIRKWGALQSVQSSQEDAKQEDANRPPAAEAASTAPPTREPAQFFPKAPSSGAPHRAEAFPADPRRTRSSARSTWPSNSTVANVLWGVVIATLCLVAVLFLRNGARLNPFARSGESQNENISAPPATDAQTSPRLDIPAAGSLEDRRPSRGAPARGTDSKSAPADTPVARNSAQERDDVDSADSVLATSSLPASNAPRHSDSLQTDPAAAKQPLETAATADFSRPNVTGATGSAGGLSASGNATPNSSAQLAGNEPARTPAGTNGAASSGASTTSSEPIAASTGEASPAAAGTPADRGPKSDAPATEIHLPNRHREYLNLPGELVLESSSVTMRVERSVLMPGGHIWWPFNRNKKLVVGELVSRVDPQPAQVQPDTGSSVRVKATVAKDGRIESVTPVNGPATLLPAVVRAIREWRYQPTLMDDKPVETECHVVVQFHSPAGRAGRQ
jgi:hypothetical protein